MPDSGFWRDPGRWQLLWDYIRWGLETYMPFIMLVVGMFLATALVTIIVNLFNRDKNKDDDDEIEFL